MKAVIDRQTTPHRWVLGTIAVLLSVASALSYIFYSGQGIIVGDLLGLPGREADVVLAQHRATYWLMASLGCWAGSIVAAAFALPFFADASRLARLFARFILASILSLALTVIIRVASFSVIGSLHHSVVR
jgi:hypothetical protein